MGTTSLRTLVPRRIRRALRPRPGSGPEPAATEPDAPEPATLDELIAPPEPVSEPVAPAEPQLACRAPFTSLHVDQFGDARPCCQSSRVLGNVSEVTLGEIWRGAPLAELRTAIADGDLSLGCEHCEWSGRQGRETTYAVRFDHDRLPAPDAGPTRLELAPSNACNLQCTMCNGDWSSSIRLHREGRPALPRLFGREQLDEVASLAPDLDEIHLFGGEPLLMPEGLRLLDIGAASGTRCVITTNGSVFTPRVAALLDRPGVDLVVSVDGTSPEVYESIRCGADWAVLQDHLDEFQALAARHGNRVDVAHCLMTTNWHEFPDHLAWAAARGLGVYVNDVLSPVEASLHHLAPPELAAVIGHLRSRQALVDQLDEPWRATWEQALAGLEQTLADGSAGTRHAHLGTAYPTQAAIDGDGSDPTALLRSRLGDGPAERRTRIELRLDHQLLITSATSSGPTDIAPLLALDALTGRPSSAVPSLLTDVPVVESRASLTWDLHEACEDRRYGNDAHRLVERRTILAEPDHVLLRFEYWIPPSTDEERQAMDALAGGAPLIETRLGPDGRLLAIEPVEAAQRLGLRTELGTVQQGPADAFEAERADPPPDFAMRYLGPWLTAVSLSWSDGQVLVALAHTSTAGTHVLLAEPASAPA